MKILRIKIFFSFLIFLFFCFSIDFLSFEKEFNCSNCTLYSHNINFLSPKNTLVFNGLLYVLDVSRSSIFVFDEQNVTFFYTIGKNGYYDFLEEPFSLTSDENFVYSIDKNTKKIYFFPSPADHDYIPSNFLISTPASSIIYEDILWILDTANNQIISFNLSSKEIAYYLSKGFGDGKISKPLDFTFKKNYFIIADSSNNRVELFDEKLNFVSNIGLGSKGFTLKYPIAVAADEDYIYISDSDLKKIFIVNYQGELITQFNYSDLNLSNVAFIYLYQDYIYFTSEKDKKILKFLFKKDEVRGDLKAKIFDLDQKFSSLKQHFPYINSLIPNSLNELFLEVEGLLEASKTSFSAKNYTSASSYISETESKFELLNQSLYTNLSNTLTQKLSSLNKEIRNISDINLAFQLKEDLDTCYILLSKNELFLLANKTKSIQDALDSYYKKKTQPESKEQIKENASFINPEVEKYKSIYFSILDKVKRKKESLLKIAEELNYSINFVVFEQYFLASQVAEKSSDYKKATNYLLEADNQLNSISENLAEYQKVLEKLDEYNSKIIELSNSSKSLASLKLTKAYLIAKTNSSLALIEAQEALELAKQESGFTPTFLSAKNYALLIFLFILAIILILAFFVFVSLKNRLIKKEKDEHIIIIKKAKPISYKRKSK